MGDRAGRVWYGDVIMFFKAQVRASADSLITMEFAYIQWYESFGGPLQGKRHKDEGFPDVLNRRYLCATCCTP